MLQIFNEKYSGKKVTQKSLTDTLRIGREKVKAGLQVLESRKLLFSEKKRNGTFYYCYNNVNFKQVAKDYNWDLKHLIENEVGDEFNSSKKRRRPEVTDTISSKDGKHSFESEAFVEVKTFDSHKEEEKKMREWWVSIGGTITEKCTGVNTIICYKNVKTRKATRSKKKYIDFGCYQKFVTDNAFILAAPPKKRSKVDSNKNEMDDNTDEDITMLDDNNNNNNGSKTISNNNNDSNNSHNNNNDIGSDNNNNNNNNNDKEEIKELTQNFKVLHGQHSTFFGLCERYPSTIGSYQQLLSTEVEKNEWEIYSVETAIPSIHGETAQDWLRMCLNFVGMKPTYRKHPEYWKEIKRLVGTKETEIYPIVLLAAAWRNSLHLVVFRYDDDKGTFHLMFPSHTRYHHYLENQPEPNVRSWGHCLIVVVGWKNSKSKMLSNVGWNVIVNKGEDNWEVINDKRNFVGMHQEWTNADNIKGKIDGFGKELLKAKPEPYEFKPTSEIDPSIQKNERWLVKK